MSSLPAIAKTLSNLAAPGMRRKQLIAAVREKHPEASKKDIVRAAFYALTESAGSDLDKARRLRDFAIGERAIDEDEAVPAGKSRLSSKRKAAKEASRSAR